MLRSIIDAIALNEYAVGQIQKEMYHEARASLTNATASLHQLIHEQYFRTVDQQHASTHDAPKVYAERIDLRPLLLDSMNCNTSGHFAFFGGIFRIHLIGNFSNDGSYYDEDLAQSVLCITLYNLALVYHVSATAQRCSRGLAVALRLYELSQITVHEPCGDENAEDLAEVLLATINNTGQIHSMCFNLQQIQETIPRLSAASARFCRPDNVRLAANSQLIFYFACHRIHAPSA
jgi:hypothetical protein